VTPSPQYDQRWSDRREAKRTPGDRIDPSEYGVDVIRTRDAKAYVCRHHYSGSYPADHLAVGLFRKTGAAPAALVGVAVFSEGVRSQAAMPRWTGYGRDVGTELGRLVLAPEVAYNGESWFLRRAFGALRSERPHVRVVLSYADPIERRDAAGALVKPGHFGTIYQASNAVYAGRSEPRTLRMAPNGTVIHPYAFDKVSRGRQGSDYAARQLLTAGCPPRTANETPDEWVRRVRGCMPSIRHPGNLVYVFGLDDVARAEVKKLHGGGLPYPKKGRAA
jgi:hypothetical protein